MKLLNKDVYKTAEEAKNAFDCFCTKNRCESCHCKLKVLDCTLTWLYLESDVDAPEPKEDASVIAMREKIEILATEIKLRNGDFDARTCVDKAVSMITSIRAEIKELANGSH